MSHQGLHHRARAAALLTGLVFLAFSLPALAGYEPDPSTPRSEIPVEYQWQSKDIFPDDAIDRASQEWRFGAYKIPLALEDMLFADNHPTVVELVPLKRPIRLPF